MLFGDFVATWNVQCNASSKKPNRMKRSIAQIPLWFGLSVMPLGAAISRADDGYHVFPGDSIRYSSCWFRGSPAEAAAARENQVSIRRAFFRCARPPRALRDLSRGVQRSESRLADLQQWFRRERQQRASPKD